MEFAKIKRGLLPSITPAAVAPSFTNLIGFAQGFPDCSFVIPRTFAKLRTFFHSTKFFFAPAVGNAPTLSPDFTCQLLYLLVFRRGGRVDASLIRCCCLVAHLHGIAAFQLYFSARLPVAIGIYFRDETFASGASFHPQFGCC